MSQITPELLRRYGRDLCTPAETDLVKQWLNTDQHPAQDEFAKTDQKDMASTKAEIWDAVRPRESAHADRLGKRPKRITYKAAIGLCLLMVLCSLLVHHFILSVSDHATLTEYQTHKGEKLHFKLSDGTVIHLNAMSQLKAPESFSGPNRTVYLTGEAFFEVHKDARHPFIIHTPSSDIRVLGTEFNVRCYAGDASTTVSVEGGTVKLSSKDERQQQLIYAGQSAVYQASNHRIFMEPFNEDHYAWKQNELIFDDASLTDIASKLERWFDVKISIENQTIRSYKFTGRYTDPPLSEVLDDLILAMKIHVKRNKENKTIEIN